MPDHRHEHRNIDPRAAVKFLEHLCALRVEGASNALGWMLDYVNLRAAVATLPGTTRDTIEERRIDAKLARRDD